MKKLFLLDAMALIYRAYYALIRSPRLTTLGKNTNAQFGFTSTLHDLIRKENPSHLAVAFDTQAPTERHTDFEAYKANRQEAPEDLIESLPDIKRILEGFQIPILELDGYEADDIIGTMALQAAAKGYQVYMVTPDKDYGQLVDGLVRIYKPPYMGSKEEVLGAREICAKWQIQDVRQVIDILGLMGDQVDNIPGIAGIGEKTAIKLIQEYHSLDNILAHAEEIPGKLGEKIRAGREQALLSRKLATIITNVPLEFHEESFRLKEWDKEKLAAIFGELEFRTLGKRILGEDIPGLPAVTGSLVPKDLFGDIASFEAPGPQPVAQEEALGLTTVVEHSLANTPHEYHLVQTPGERSELLALLLAQDEICFDTETTGTDANLAEIVGMSFSVTPGKGYYIPMAAQRGQAIAILEEFRPVFDRQEALVIGQNIKYDLLILKWYGFGLRGRLFDTMLAHYLIEPEGRRNMDLLAAQYLNYSPVSIETLIGKKGKGQGTMRDVELEQIKEYAAEDADITLQLKRKFEPELKEKSVERVFWEIESPLVQVLADMEFEGVRIDTEFLKEYSKELELQARESEQRVYRQAGVQFNLSSPRQLGEVLFEKLKLDPKAKKTRTGQYATGEDILLKLASRYQIVDDILAFRELTKLQSTYVDALPQLINPKTGRLHTSYNQAVAVTGRLSSNNPNLQNIPIRTERGKEIRKAFLPRDPDHVLLSADYSQIELRIVAAISGDEGMCSAFRSGLDIHSATASRVFKVPPDQVTREMRYRAKSVNFGLIYGQGAFGLSQNLDIPRAEAKELIDHYFEEYPAIRTYMDDQIAFAQKNGYVQTLWKRKRWLRDIHSANLTVRGYAERNAINMPIQGTAADMIKLAMIRIHRTIRESGLKARMILQVHDELVFDVPAPEVETLKPLVLEGMKHALELPHGVPVEAEVGSGANWLEAH